MSDPIPSAASARTERAPVVILAVEPGAEAQAKTLSAASLGFDLFEAALRGEIALSDHTACWAFMRRGRPALALDLVYGARRVATDFAQYAAQRPDAALARTCREALAAARAPLADVPDGKELPDAHAALAQVADLLGAALALTADGEH